MKNKLYRVTAVVDGNGLVGQDVMALNKDDAIAKTMNFDGMLATMVKQNDAKLHVRRPWSDRLPGKQHKFKFLQKIRNWLRNLTP